MLLVQLFVLIGGLLAYGYVWKLIHITFTLLFCLYFSYTKRYKSICLAAFLCVFSILNGITFDSGKRYQAGDLFDFSFSISLPLLLDQDTASKGSISSYMHTVDKYNFPLLQNKLLLHFPSDFLTNLTEKTNTSSLEGTWLGVGQSLVKKVIYAKRYGNWRQRTLYRKNLVAELWLDLPKESVSWHQKSHYNILSLVHHIRFSLQHSFNQFPTWRFSQSLFLGKNDRFSDKDNWQIRFLGLSHLFVVSGLHVGFIYSLLALMVSVIWTLSPSNLIYILRNKHVLSLVICTPAIVFYGFLTGWGEPVQRAVIMLFVWQLSILFQLKVSSYNILFFALLLICLVHPRSVFSASLWLSFCLVLLIISYFNGRKSSWKDWFKIQLVLTLGATCLTLGWQESISSISVLVNLFMVPFTAFIWFPAVFGASIESLVLGSTWLMSLLDYLLIYVFSILDYVSFHSKELNLAVSIPSTVKVSAFLLLLLWGVYERKALSAHLFLVVIYFSLIKTDLTESFGTVYTEPTSIWRIENITGSLRLYKNADVLLDTYWGNNLVELDRFWLNNKTLKLEKNINTSLSSVLIWPFANAQVKASLLKQLSPQWLLLKDEPNKALGSLLTAFQINWLVVTKKQSIKIEFWRDYWYIRHSNCLIVINLLQEKNCQRVVLLENMIN